jgi:D-sedoheptulose 7-phosphate isomerase
MHRPSFSIPLSQTVDELGALLEQVAGECAPALNTAAETCVRALQSGHKIIFFGNGGSATQAQHLAAELINRFCFDRAPLAALALTPDAAVTTSIGNDYSFNEIFSRQLSGLGRAGDVAVALSTSGTSNNISTALFKARELQIHTIAFLGRDGGDCLKLCDNAILVSGQNTARIQEAHLLLGHLLCEAIEKNIFPS